MLFSHIVYRPKYRDSGNTGLRLENSIIQMSIKFNHVAFSSVTSLKSMESNPFAIISTVHHIAVV